MVHNQVMVKKFLILIVSLTLGSPWLSTAWGQTSTDSGDSDDSSEQVEQREDSYRRQMELEDARSKNRAYVDTTYTESANQEKIDKLPPESRENIRDQLVDIIVENGEWEPSDVFGDYPYQPTEAAEADSELMEQELAAWEEQLEKYHQREAEAFGANRGPVPGPGNPTGQEGGGQGEGSQGKQGGQQGSNSAASAGTYEPYQPVSTESSDEVSTAGVSESALDFLRGNTAQSQAGGQVQTAGEQADESSQDETAQVAEQSTPEDAENSEDAQEASSSEITPNPLGIIAIEDLDKLEGTEVPVETDDSGNP